MAVSTYTELVAWLESRSHRSGFHTSRIPDYIANAEKRIAQVLRPRGTETETELTATTDSRYVALPSDFQSLRALWCKFILPRTQLYPRLPEYMPVSTTSGVPSYYAIDGSNIAFDRPAVSAFTLDLRYDATLNIASTTTNEVLTRYPMLYQQGALAELKEWEEDDQGMARAESRFQQLLSEAMNAENANREVTLQTELCGPGRSNIFEG